MIEMGQEAPELKFYVDRRRESAGVALVYIGAAPIGVLRHHETLGWLPSITGASFPDANRTTPYSLSEAMDLVYDGAADEGGTLNVQPAELGARFIRIGRLQVGTVFTNADGGYSACARGDEAPCAFPEARQAVAYVLDRLVAPPPAGVSAYVPGVVAAKPATTRLNPAA